MSEPQDRPDLPGQLEAIRLRLDATNPALYRHLALYLQVLRQILPGRLEQACFHLATQVHPRRYAGLPGRQREELHRRRQVLVQRCCSLLTVEQLASLATQIHRERRRQERQAQQRLLEHLEPSGTSAPPTADSPGPREPGPRENPFLAMAAGSVQLGLALPLSPGFLGWDPGAAKARAEHKEGLSAAAAPTEASRGEGSPGEGSPGEGSSGGSSPGETETAQILLQGFGDALGDSLDDLLEEDPESPDPSPWQQGRLPREPLLLLHWLEGMERALARRLRNLSHALNVELLRVGVSRTLLPVSLLDAVLNGQLEPMAAPANVLQLQLPFGADPGPGPARVVAVLLRSSDLEMEEPKLRTCRRRLHEHRQEVRRMAGQFRRLQRRLQAREAEELWLQDIRRTRPPSD